MDGETRFQCRHPVTQKHRSQHQLDFSAPIVLTVETHSIRLDGMETDLDDRPVDDMSKLTERPANLTNLSWKYFSGPTFDEIMSFHSKRLRAHVLVWLFLSRR